MQPVREGHQTVVGPGGSYKRDVSVKTAYVKPAGTETAEQSKRLTKLV